MYIQLFTYIHAHTIMYTQLNMCRHVCIHNNIQCMGWWWGCDGGGGCGGVGGLAVRCFVVPALGLGRPIRTLLPPPHEESHLSILRACAGRLRAGAPAGLI